MRIRLATCTPQFLQFPKQCNIHSPLAVVQGYHGDTSSMFTCGKVDAKAQRLCDATKEALEAAIKVCKPGAPTRQIGAACTAVADKHKCAAPRLAACRGSCCLWSSRCLLLHANPVMHV